PIYEMASMCWRSKLFVVVALLAATAFNQTRSQESSGKNVVVREAGMHTDQKKVGLVIHGGAGTIERDKMTPEREREYRAGLERALTAGWEILQNGGARLGATDTAGRVRESGTHD